VVAQRRRDVQNRLEGLAEGTYYWQVKTADVPMEADGGQWWPFTVGTPPVAFGKQTPAAGAIVTANAATLWWDAAAGAQYYEVCLDTVNNGSCDTSWQLNGVSTSRLVTGLTDGTYYWQVRAQTAGGPVLADNGTWWSVTIDAPDPIREYIYLGGTLLASLTLTTGTPVLTYYHTDVLGSVRAITDAAGASVIRHDYFAFGESASALGGDPRRFLGQELDFETGFDHFGARQYRNVWGRFGSVDPVLNLGRSLADPQLLNRYSYGRSNPLKYLDPDGREVIVQDAVSLNLIRDALPQSLQKYVKIVGNKIDVKELMKANTLDPLFMALLGLAQMNDAVVVSSGLVARIVDGRDRERDVELYYDRADRYFTGYFVPPAASSDGRSHIYLFNRPGNIPPVPPDHMLRTAVEEIAHAALFSQGKEHRDGIDSVEKYIELLRRSIGKR
jgi:RHS repeat-associated protein